MSSHDLRLCRPRRQSKGSRQSPAFSAGRFCSSWGSLCVCRRVPRTKLGGSPAPRTAGIHRDSKCCATAMMPFPKRSLSLVCLLFCVVTAAGTLPRQPVADAFRLENQGVQDSHANSDAMQPSLGSATNHKATGTTSFVSVNENEEGMSQKAIIVFIVAISAMVICIGVVLVMWWMSSEREKKRRHVARDAERAPGLFFSEDEGPMSTDEKSAPKKPAGGNSPNTRDAGESISRERQIIEEDLGKVLVVDPVSGVMRSRQKWQRNGNSGPDKRMLAGAERTCRTGQQKFKK
ncbi:putative transmembrane protein [Toxoplasma gondii GAB2-2007-GAL-DOM2]|uniref:Transmembrane protein n=3 Tax=Toxoplasma gondii TaxID=5811 RepID=V5B2V5_TOXGV|nr:putative transmembrane protein [Toxoplasma gondii VEG]KFG36409.1 putative transmembrane protein [Toxoplasma gondii p89]KFG41482.1 putative transmembrane protein [Toxoplasma gondii GAB2-2007-GAL-DOM2]